MNYRQKPTITIRQTAAISFLDVVGLILIFLKLTDHITWSWIWVLAPFWLPIAVIVAILLAAFVVFAIMEGIDNWKRRKKG